MSNMNSNRRQATIGVLILLTGLLLLVSLRNDPQSEKERAKPATEAGRAKLQRPETPARGQPTPYQEYQDKRNEALESAKSKAADQGPGYSFNISKDRRDKLFQITGQVAVGGLNVGPGRTELSIEEVLQMYPFLTSSDGTVNHALAKKIQGLLTLKIAEMHKTHRKITEAVRKGESTISFAKEARSAVVLELEEIIKSFYMKPERIIPKDALLKVAPALERAETRELAEYLVRVAMAQTYADEGRPVENNRKLVKQALPYRLHITLSDEQADYLLRTPLDELAVGVFNK